MNKNIERIKSEEGIKYYFKKAPQKLLRIFLFRIYKFDKWHKIPPIDKIWIRTSIDFLNKKSIRDSCIDIACGLGDIVRKLNYKKRLGVDLFEEVLKGAKFLSIISLNWKIKYIKFEFPKDSLNGKFDAILLISLCHIIDPKVLKTKISEYFNNNLNENGCILIEIVHHIDKLVYPINHDIKYLTNEIDCELKLLSEYHPKKELWAIIKNNIA